jgi:hypothetical protein
MVKRLRKRLPKKYLYAAFRPVLLGIESLDVEAAGGNLSLGPMVMLKLLTIGEDTETFRKTMVPRKRLQKYLEKQMVRVPEGRKEELAAILLEEKLEAAERKAWL